jgi:hypothetical protein
MQSNGIKIIATIHRNLRDSESMYPKVLLTDIEGISRDHCWVDVEHLTKVLPRTNKTKLRIQFDCDTKEYFSIKVTGKITLTNIRNVQVLHKM